MLYFYIPKRFGFDESANGASLLRKIVGKTKIINRSHVLPVTKVVSSYFSQTNESLNQFVPCLGYHWRLGKHVCSLDRSLILLRHVSLNEIRRGKKVGKIDEDNIPPEERDANFSRDHHHTSQVVPQVMLCHPAMK